jgi:diguanylate cyclase (GGDEF)-like protein
MTFGTSQAIVPRDTSLPNQSPKIGSSDLDEGQQASSTAATLKEQIEVRDRCEGPRFCLVAGMFGLLSMIFLVWMVVLGGYRITKVMDNVVQLLAGLVAMAMCATAARRHRQRWTGWALLSVALFLSACGDGVWGYYAILRGELVSASLAGTVCIASVVPLAVVAVLTLPGASSAGEPRLRGLLDSVLIGTGMFFLGWTLVLGPIYQHQSGALSVEIFNLAYPSGNIVIASLAIILATRAGGRNRVTLGLVSAGLMSCAVADTSFSYLMAVHGYGIGNVTDTGWVLGYFLIALGALYAWNHPLVSDDNSARPTGLTLIGPNLPLVGVLAAAAWQVVVHHSLDRVSQISFVAVVLTMAVRQLLVLRDHLALSRQLESKVEQRTVELRHQAFHDGLTGLANRALFNQYLDDAIQSRNGSCTGLGVLLIDLHNFKHVNDLHGHSVGDELLRLVAVRLRAISRGADLIARVGGDEFGMLLQDHGPQLEIEQVVRPVIAALARPFAIGSTSLVVEAAMGLAAGGPEETCGDDLLRDAGLALGAAKANGGHCCEVYSPLMYSSLLEDLRTEADMRSALERDEFVVYYQPVVDLSTVTIQGLEALVRWDHPQRGFLGPDNFIPVAEATGIIGAIGTWVLRQACRDIAAMARVNPLLWISVNLSALQLEDENLVATISESLQQSGLDAHRLTLEVTETVIMNDVPRSIQVLTALRKLGVKIAIDDFGTGYSSLGALRYLPVDTLKIDRSFVKDLARDKASADLTRRTLQLAADFRLHTVAEGVEEVEQLEILREFGCEAVQGFLFAKPQPVAEIINLLTKGLQPPEPASILGTTDGPRSGYEIRRRNSNGSPGSEFRHPGPRGVGEPASVVVR